MKPYQNFLSAILLIFNLNFLNAQSGSTRSNSIQFDYGISNTLHYNQPVDLIQCIEGCFPEMQKPRLASNVNISFYRTYQKKNSIKIGIGYAKYRFWESGFASPGNHSLYPYEVNRAFEYLNFSTGFKHKLTSSKKINPFVETSLMVEFLAENNYLLKGYGLANMSQIGTSIHISRQCSVEVGTFFKTGIVKYNERIINKNYIPFGYGIQVGLNVILDAQMVHQE